ncbi:MAG: GntR family transcriptional regulator [Lachnospiraceae bacterium]|nr:GntR family transcriptional regulator [Lachnospiraceae bacterium]
MISIDKQSRVPVYEQLIDAFEKEIMLGIRESDSMIPSVRTLSVELGVNPNTVQKAYLELERRNITYSVPGVGRFVSKDGAAILKKDLGEAEELLKKAVERMKQAEVPLADVLKKVTSLYETERKNDGGRQDD